MNLLSKWGPAVLDDMWETRDVYQSVFVCFYAGGEIKAGRHFIADLSSNRNLESELSKIDNERLT